MRDYLDLQKAPHNREEHNIYKARTRAVALTFARRYGWSAKNLRLACSHVDAWWVIAQCIGDQMTFLCRDGSWVTLPYPGYVKK